MSELIRLDGEYTTRDGRPVRVLCVDKLGGRPVIALVGEPHGEDLYHFYLDGRYSNPETSNLDLIPKPKRETQFWRLFPHNQKWTGPYRSIAEAERFNIHGVSKLVRTESIGEEVVAVSLEPLSEEGA